MPRVSAVFAALAGALVGAVRGQDDASQKRFQLRDIHVQTRNVFTEEEGADNLFYYVINALHWPTDPEVIRRELWFGPGDPITADDAAQLERNLRRMRLFGEVDAEVEDLGDGRGDLRISSRDQFSLTVRGGAGFVGGVTTFDAAIGDSNLFGTGKRILVSGSREGEDESIGVAYTDPQLFGSWHQLRLTLGETNEGPFGSIGLTKPFKHLADPISYGTSFSTVDRAVQYFASGETIAEVPEDRIDAQAFAAHGFGPLMDRRSIGGDIRVRSSDYSPARGPDASTIRVPGDTNEFQLGVFGSVDYAAEFLKVTEIDTMDFVQDIKLGIDATLRPAFVLRDEEPTGTEPQGLVEGVFRSAFSPASATYLTTDLSGHVRFDDDQAQSYSVSAALHGYHTSLPAQTLAASLTYDQLLELQDLEPQLTLGEDNGLRGYPAREFAGTRRTRLNLEDRIFTGLEVLSVQVGLAAFYDVGWVHNPDQGLSLDDAWRSVGLGLRLGSSELSGGEVFRIDVAWPLDDRAGEDFGVSLSISSGQVFNFFGNSSTLRDEFAGFIR